MIGSLVIEFVEGFRQQARFHLFDVAQLLRKQALEYFRLCERSLDALGDRLLSWSRQQRYFKVVLRLMII